MAKIYQFRAFFLRDRVCKGRLSWGVLFALVLFSLLTIPISAKKGPLLTKDSFYIRANTVTYLGKIDTVIAEGHVLIFTENRTLLADRVVFHRSTGVIEAIGNVWLRTPGGDYVYTQEGQFTYHLKEGEAARIRMIQTDESRFAAEHVNYRDQDILLEKASYTPCKLCQNADHLHPTWQLKADTIHYSQEDETVYYQNAYMEVLGWPVFFTPFLRHAAPHVKRKSGLLVPIFATGRDLGVVYGQSVYYVSRDWDATITPMITTHQGPVVIGEWRKCFRNAYMIMSGSITRTRHIASRALIRGIPRDRWHTWVESRVEPSDHHLITLRFKRASDLTYLRRYPILADRFYRAPHTKNLTSLAQIEQFYPQSYMGAIALLFQTDDKDITPFVLPQLKADYQSNPGRWGQMIFAQGAFRALGRRVDLPGIYPKDSQLATSHLGMKLPYVSSWGDEWITQVGVRGGLYRLNHYRYGVTDRSHSLVQGYGTPQASLTWRYPFIAHYSYVNWVLEPQVMFASSLNNRRLDHLPNEDSSNVELDYTTLFLTDRFPGLDRYDEGTRVTYGLNNRWFFGQGRRVILFLGQTHRLDHRMVLPQGAGEDNVASDVVVRIKIDPVPWLAIQHQGRLQRKTLRPQISELSTLVGPQWCRVAVGHIYLAPQSLVGLPRIHQLNWQVSAKLTTAWAASYSENRNLTIRGGGVLARRLMGTYTTDCIQVSLGFYQTHYRDRDIRPDVGALFNLQFKNLGDFNPMSSPSATGDVFTTPY